MTGGKYIVECTYIDLDPPVYFERREWRFETFVEAEQFALEKSTDPFIEGLVKLFREDMPELLPARYANGKRLLEVTE